MGIQTGGIDFPDLDRRKRNGAGTEGNTYENGVETLDRYAGDIAMGKSGEGEDDCYLKGEISGRD